MTKAKTKHRGAIADDYLDLVRRFPLRPIRNEAEAEQAAQVLRGLLVKADRDGLSDGQTDYADALVVFVRQYDQEHAVILQDVRQLKPIDALKALMEANGMNVSNLGELLGSGSGQASLILRGKRELSKANIRTLAKRFRVSPALFL